MPYRIYKLKEEFKIVRMHDSKSLALRERDKATFYTLVQEPDDIYLVYYNPTAYKYSTDQGRARLKLRERKSTFLLIYNNNYVRQNEMENYFVEIPPMLLEKINKEYFQKNKDKFAYFQEN